jgi:hypothetical protein
MATASGDGNGTRRPPLTPYIAYAVVLVFVAWAGVAFWTGGWGNRPAPRGGERGVPAKAAAEPVHDTAGLKLPPRQAATEAAAASRQEPAVSPVPQQPPPKGETSTGDPAASAVEKPVPVKTQCSTDVGAWPGDKTDQGKAIQILLRDLGFYSGTTYGTVGPTTRAAIRAFQVAAGDAETGEPSEMLFESLRKRCAAPAP